MFKLNDLVIITQENSINYAKVGKIVKSWWIIDDSPFYEVSYQDFETNAEFIDIFKEKDIKLFKPMTEDFIVDDEEVPMFI